MKTILPLFFIAALPLLKAHGQPIVDTYIRTAFANNQSVQQQRFLLQRSLYALEEARRLFRPSVNFSTTYTRAAGGRTIDFPLGDLFNPVYKTLNDLARSQAFAPLENQRILLNPDNFYDVKFRTTYPLLNVEIQCSQRISQQRVDLQRIEIDLFKRELAKDVKVGYYRYLQATEGIRIYENALTLVTENQRVNTVLFANQKVNRTTLVRSTNEVTKVQAQVEVAHQAQLSAQAYVNFLLNRPAYSVLEVLLPDEAPGETALADTAVSGREELAKLAQARAINDNLIKLSATFRKPKVNLFLDVGSQGFNFAANRNTPYYFGGISLDWSVFAGGRNLLRVKQAEQDGLAIGASEAYVSDQLRLQITTARHELRSVLAQYRAARSQVAASGRNYRDTERLYREGQVLYMEMLDAQNQFITDQLQVNITRFDAWSKQAELERATATLSLSN